MQPHFSLIAVRFYYLVHYYRSYRINLKDCDRQVWANSVDPDQTPRSRRLIRVYTVCNSSSQFQTRQQVVKCSCSNFRWNKVKSEGVPIFTVNTVYLAAFLKVSGNKNHIYYKILDRKCLSRQCCLIKREQFLRCLPPLSTFKAQHPILLNKFVHIVVRF